jgi:hypothetical protein
MKHDRQPSYVSNHGQPSVVLSENDGFTSVSANFSLKYSNKSLREILPPYVLTPEQLADILDEPHTRRAWWLNLHTGCDLLTGTTIDDLEAKVKKFYGGSSLVPAEPDGVASAELIKGSLARVPLLGSDGQPAVAPVSSLSRCLRIDHAHTIDAGCWELRTFEQRRAEVQSAPVSSFTVHSNRAAAESGAASYSAEISGYLEAL